MPFGATVLAAVRTISGFASAPRLIGFSLSPEFFCFILLLSYDFF